MVRIPIVAAAEVLTSGLGTHVGGVLPLVAAALTLAAVATGATGIALRRR